MVTAGALLHFAQAAVAGARQHAQVMVLAISLLTALICLILSGERASLTPNLLMLVTLATLGAQIIAAALLDRSRTAGLVSISVIGGVFLTPFLLSTLPHLMPAIPSGGLLLVVLIATSLIGLIGSARLPMHPLRPSILLHAAGLGVLALLITCLNGLHHTPSMATAISALTAASASLFIARRHRHPAPLSKAMEGLLAGVIITTLCPADLQAGLVAGLVAALCVARGEAITRALVIDDPARLAGTLLLPAIAGLLLPGFVVFDMLAEQLQWLGITLAISLMFALLAWPVTMAIFGLAANPRRVREGLDFQL